MAAQVTQRSNQQVGETRSTIGMGIRGWNLGGGVGWPGWLAGLAGGGFGVKMGCRQVKIESTAGDG